MILPRNAHLSALSICAVAGIEPVFADLTETKEGWAIVGPEHYRAAIGRHPDAKAVFAVNCDYFGLLCDLPAIAALAHEAGMLLLCDEAHGATFNWRADVHNAGTYGADLFVQSAHKTLPALNTSAWLHAASGLDATKLRSILRMVQTSSPSFVLMQSMDDARAWMDEYGCEACARMLTATENFRHKAAALGFTDTQQSYPADRLRLVLRASLGGKWLQDRLQAHGVDVEMSDSWHVVCILSLLDGEKRLELLLDALSRIAAEPAGEQAAPDLHRLYPSVWPERRIPLCDAAFAQAETVDPGLAVGRVSAACVGVYPPGISWLTPGDEVTEEIAELIVKTPAYRMFGLDGGLRCVT